MILDFLVGIKNTVLNGHAIVQGSNLTELIYGAPAIGGNR
jgi:hypothetical protein